MQVLRILGASVAAILIVAAPPFKMDCQEVELGSLRAGMRVRVQQNGQGPVIGTLTDILKDTIVYQPLAPSVVKVPLSSIERLEVSIGSRRGWERAVAGAVLGGVVGAIIGGTARKTTECTIGPGNHCDTVGPGGGAIAGAVLGGVAGAILGAPEKKTERWQRVRLDRPQGI
jgi:outer membrane lipoprotein SlyB